MYRLKPFLFFPVFLFVLAVNSGDINSKKTFGEKIQLTETTNLDDVIANYENFKNKKVLLQGEVKKVCQMKGCWLTLVNPNHDVRVMFKDYGFTVPKDIKGRTVKLEGQMIEKTIKPKDQKHFLKDEGATQAQIEAVREPKKVYRFIAEAVELI